MARPSVYDQKIKPYIDDIKEAVRTGATVKEIAAGLGVSQSTLEKYKAEFPELKGAFAEGRAHVVFKIKAALYDKAIGFFYEESTEKVAPNGDVTKYTYTKYSVPNETAAAMLLRNYDKNWRDGDNASAELRRRESDLKVAIAKASNYDDLGVK